MEIRLSIGLLRLLASFQRDFDGLFYNDRGREDDLWGGGMKTQKIIFGVAPVFTAFHKNTVTNNFRKKLKNCINFFSGTSIWKKDQKKILRKKWTTTIFD